jgi:hypothetical protein
MGEERFFVIDVESIGLHGEGFAVGIVVIGVSGTVYEVHQFSCPPSAAEGTYEGRVWVGRNVPRLIPTADSPTHMRDQFWAIWEAWRRLGVPMVADCAWPVEARFLAACVDDDPERRSWRGPLPLQGAGHHQDPPAVLGAGGVCAVAPGPPGLSCGDRPAPLQPGRPRYP